MQKFALPIILCVVGGFLCAQAPAQINNPRKITYRWKTNTKNRMVALSEITGVVPRKTFPIIDFPQFYGKTGGLANFFRHEPVIAVAINGEAKAYPLNMLTMHEIANDSLGGIPILPTYCPLCNASIVYDRRLTFQGQTHLLEFEVSGMLRNSDMIMFDRQTESWWQQLMGQCIVGDYTGSTLMVIPSLVLTVGEFFQRYPKGKILSPRTGTSAEGRYGNNPYVNYDNLKNSPYGQFIHPSKIDSRLPAMERVVDIRSGKKYKIYPFSKIRDRGVINDRFEGKNVVIFYQAGAISVLDAKNISQSKKVGTATVFDAELKGRVLVFEKRNNYFIDQQTNSKWDITGLCRQGSLKGQQLRIEPHSNHFAFAWLAFYPDSEIFLR